MKTVGGMKQELSVEERNLLSVAYKNAVGSRRAAWRIITSVEQKEKTKGNSDNAGYAKLYCKKVEGELQDMRYDSAAVGQEPHRQGLERRIKGLLPEDEGRLLP